MVVHVFVDGSCRGNGKTDAIGAYGIYFNDYRFREWDTVMRLHGPKITNNVAELTAILHALDAIMKSGSDEQFVIVSDSKYAISCVTGIYNGKMNIDLINRCRELLSQSNGNVSFLHTRSHQPEPKDKRSTEWYFWAGNNFIDDSINQIYN
jgi:ribonuclease HI